MMRRLCILVPLLLGACQAQGSDGYRFEGAEFERARPAISIVTHPSLADLRAKAPAAALRDRDRDLMAWSIIRPGECEVHIVDPVKEWRPEWIGHEVAHCAWGRWHP